MATELEEKIIKQIEYYFGDYNLPKDKFLQEQIAKDEGWVELSVLLTFVRLAKLSNDPEVIVAALKKSESNLVVVSEDGKKVRRNPEKAAPEFTEERKKEITARSAYAKGFPPDEPLDDIIKYLSDNHGSIESCTKRGYVDRATNERKHKNSCFVVFTNLEDCKKFVEAEEVKYKDVELIRKYQSAYIDEKKEEYAQRKNVKKGKQKEEEIKVLFPKGTVFHFTVEAEDCVLTREEIKLKVTESSGNAPAYIDYNKGEKEGHVRMEKENGAVEFCGKLKDNTMEIAEVKLKIKLLEGEDEDNYIKKAAEFMQKRKQTGKRGRRNNKWSGNRDEGPKNKKTKL
ncbi:hypothetical protein PPYR_08350 [Photinus pyralis]|uniref:Uncharacterized protein n=2 Tax=Photinus pyralis TaxID=7054 RepID=A0A5N4AJ89_PHOPY|nr:la protein homolog [Photinus pyralis]KAB0797356.1 hypothetical protein PPYR_08350 [Photinus pyralis]